MGRAEGTNSLSGQSMESSVSQYVNSRLRHSRPGTSSSLSYAGQGLAAMDRLNRDVNNWSARRGVRLPESVRRMHFEEAEKWASMKALETQLRGDLEPDLDVARSFFSGNKGDDAGYDSWSSDEYEEAKTQLNRPVGARARLAQRSKTDDNDDDYVPQRNRSFRDDSSDEDYYASHVRPTPKKNTRKPAVDDDDDDGPHPLAMLVEAMGGSTKSEAEIAADDEVRRDKGKAFRANLLAERNAKKAQQQSPEHPAPGDSRASTTREKHRGGGKGGAKGGVIEHTCPHGPLGLRLEEGQHGVTVMEIFPDSTVPRHLQGSTLSAVNGRSVPDWDTCDSLLRSAGRPVTLHFQTPASTIPKREETRPVGMQRGAPRRMETWEEDNEPTVSRTHSQGRHSPQENKREEVVSARRLPSHDPGYQKILLMRYYESTSPGSTAVSEERSRPSMPKKGKAARWDEIDIFNCNKPL